MINIVDPKDCCGCTACASICKHNAISMKPDALGFLYPEVDVSKCIDCGLCDNVCAFNNNYDTSLNLSVPVAYGARHKNIEEVMKSRSGAVFAAITDYILENGGVVYGAGYKDHFRVCHKRAITKGDRDEFRNSKYVQSDLTGVFRQVKADLKNGMLVLFSGTPCQTSGLNSFVGRKLRENLILIDIVCHGVPGPFLWRDYIAYLEKKEGAVITSVNFRDKELFGWSAHKETFVFLGRKMWYTRTFYQHIMFRHSCGNCHFCNTKRPSDITLGDFWGWEKDNPEANKDNKGLSLVLINTHKGQEILNDVKDKLDIFEATPAAYLQPNLRHPSKIHKKRMEFEHDYSLKGFDYVFEHNYNNHPLWYRILSKIYHLLKINNR